MGLSSPRDVAVDVVRAVAVICMVLAHVHPFVAAEIGAADAVFARISDAASPVFGLVMGVALGLAVARVPAGSAGARVRRELARGVVVFGLGVALSALDHWVAIVLQVLGALMLLGAPAVLLRTRWVAALTVAALVVAPLTRVWVMHRWSPIPNGSGGPGDQVVAALLNGTSYRALSLLPFYLLGVLVARSGPRERSTLAALGLTAAGAALVVALADARSGWGQASGDPGDQTVDLALALGLYVTVVLAVQVGSRSGPGRRMAEALAVLGRLALSLYVAHILVLVIVIPRQEWPGATQRWLSALAVLAIPLLAAWTWGRWVGRGPLEWAVDRLTRAGPRPPRASPALPRRT